MPRSPAPPARTPGPAGSSATHRGRRPSPTAISAYTLCKRSSAARASTLSAGTAAPSQAARRRRPAYHAAASIASNYLVTLQAAAEDVATATGLSREEARAILVPLVRGAVENWAVRGPEAALTGPIARGDEATVARQRDAVARHP